MDTNLTASLYEFVQKDISEVYNDCYFSLTEERTAIIFHSCESYVRMAVTQDSDSEMYIQDIRSGEDVIFSVEEGQVVSDFMPIDNNMAVSIVQRYMNLMESFVQFASTEG